MQRLSVVILEHVSRGERHLDWLMEPPGEGAGRERLVAMRLRAAGSLRAALPGPGSESRAIRVEPIPPHRRRYLVYQGELSGGRGRVRRVARGWAAPVVWAAGRFVLDVRLDGWRGRVRGEVMGSGRGAAGRVVFAGGVASS